MMTHPQFEKIFFSLDFGPNIIFLDVGNTYSSTNESWFGTRLNEHERDVSSRTEEKAACGRNEYSHMPILSHVHRDDNTRYEPK